jgi:hypothetical protein
MGKKYSINSAGRIVAERDIYSLGGLIPKGRVGAKIADETQLSQNGECWVAGGDMSTNPWVKVSDNVYIGDYSAGGVTAKTNPAEIKGNTLIPGAFRVYLPATLPTSDLVIKDSFIGVTMDVLFGVSSKCHPVEQGRYNQDAPKGTLFTSASMKLDANNFVRNTATVRLGKDTYVYLPAGFNARIYWAYYDVSNQLAYAGESETVSTNLYKLRHPVYNMCMIAFAKNPTLTPAELEASGAKILGHVSGSIITEVRGSSEYGAYVMDNSSLKIQTDNFGLVLSPIRTLAGRMINTTCVTEALTQRKVFGTFTNIDYMEYFWDGDTNHRDTVITASDCPLLRVSPNTIKRSLLDTGTLVLRNCIVPAGDFEHDVIDGDTYENIDFSYTREFLSTRVVNRRLICSHRQGLYNMFAEGGNMLGRISYPDNVKDATSLTESHEIIMLDGSMIESGTYAGDPGKAYEDNKIPATNRVRMIRPVSTRGAVFPNIPAGYSVRAVHYLDESFILRKAVENPSTMEGEFPFYVMSFQKTDPNANLPASEFVSKNAYLNVNNYTKVPEITGSAYLGAGVIVRGDVQLHGDPYVNRVFDINEWDRGGLNTAPGLTWDVMKDGRNSDVRMTTKSIYPVNPGDTISVSGAYRILLCWFNEDRKLMSDTGWNDGTLTVPANVHYVGIALSTKPDLKFIDFSDVPLAGVKYLRAFKKRRYITNELDRKSPEDILLADYYWEQGAFYTDTGRVGRPYNDIKYTQSDRLRLSKPLPAGNATLTVANYWEYAMAKFDAGTRLLESSSEGYSMVSMTLRKAPPVTVNPSDAKDARLVITCIPQPRIIVPYGSNTLNINGVKIRMYDNAVLSRNFNQEGSITLQGDAVMGYDFDSGACLCSNGHDDAIIKLP